MAIHRLDDRWIELVRDTQLRGPLMADSLGWAPEEIVLTKGCDARPHEAAYCERLIAAFPHARIVDRRDIPHNRVPVPGDDAVERIDRGKRTLVLGAIRHAVARNCDPEATAGTLCAPYHAVHPTWFCFYNCAFCYLCGSPGVSFSPTVRLFTNLQDILAAMSAVVACSRRIVSFYVGKVQDGLQLDPLTGYTRVLAPFVRAHANAHLVFLTKSTAVEGLLAAQKRGGRTCGRPGVQFAPEAMGAQFRPSDGRGRVAVSWSLSPPEVVEEYEWGTPSFEERLEAARRCAEMGLEVRFVVMPLLPIADWREAYSRAIHRALRAVKPSRITLGSICSYPCALSATRRRLGPTNLIPRLARTGHGRRLRFDLATRGELYRHLRQEIAHSAPEVPVGLCLESVEAWQAAGLDSRQCRCNCIAD